MRRDPLAKKFYASAQWKRLREQVLRANDYLCQMCIQVEILEPAVTVHHTVPIRENYSLRAEWTNLVPLCEGCHNQMHKEKGGNH